MQARHDHFVQLLKASFFKEISLITEALRTEENAVMIKRVSGLKFKRNGQKIYHNNFSLHVTDHICICIYFIQNKTFFLNCLNVSVKFMLFRYLHGYRFDNSCHFSTLPLVHTTQDYLSLLRIRAMASFILLFFSHANVLKNFWKIISETDNNR